MVSFCHTLVGSVLLEQRVIEQGLTFSEVIGVKPYSSADPDRSTLPFRT